MGYRNVSKGLKIVFACELADALFFLQIGINFFPFSETVSSIIFAVLSAIIAVIEVYGLRIAGREEDAFNAAWKAVIAQFVAKISIDILWMTDSIASITGTDFMTMIFDSMATLFIIRAIRNVYEKKGLSTRFVRLMAIVILISTAIGVVSSLWSGILKYMLSSSNIAVFIFLALYFLSFFAIYVLNLVVIKRASKKCVA